MNKSQLETDQKRLKNLAINFELNKELVLNSASASFGFFMVSVWIMYSKLEVVTSADTILALGFCLMLLAVSRYGLYCLYQKNILPLNQAATVTRINIVVNAILWMLVNLVAINEFRFKNFNSSLMVIFIILGLAMASVVTLAPSLAVAFAYQWILALPPAFYLAYLGHYENNSAAVNAAVGIFIAVIYLVRETRHGHLQIVKRISNALDLKSSNLLLQESQELLIKETAKLQHATRLATIGEISGEVAHEINNPLAIIKGNISLMLLWVEQPKFNIETLTEKLKKSAAAVDRITKIVRGLKNFSRETDRDAYVSSSLDGIIHDSLEFCSEKFSYNQIKLEVKSDPSYQITCRPIEISQVLLNILSNAISALGETPAGNRWISVVVESHADFYKISISNSGPAITQAHHEKLFQPFFSTKKAGDGTGLGLSISKAIIEAHRGRLYHDAKQEQTTFVIEVPKADVRPISPKL